MISYKCIEVSENPFGINNTKSTLANEKCNLSEEAHSCLWNARSQWTGINAGFNGYIDSGAVLTVLCE